MQLAADLLDRLAKGKYARRILAIVSTTSIPIAASQNPGGQCGPDATGSRLDENHSIAGSLFHEKEHRSGQARDSNGGSIVYHRRAPRP
jgi:hypothetical protein